MTISEPTPTLLSVKSTGTLVATWDAVDGAESYILRESADGGATWKDVYHGDQVTVNLMGRVPGSYSYELVVRYLVDSPVSNILAIDVGAAAP
jgi:hypothetical protein